MGTEGIYLILNITTVMALITSDLNKQNKMQGFRGFKLQVWESSDYKNMLSSNKIYPATRNGVHEVVSKPKTRSHVRSTKTSKRSKRNVFNRTGGLCPQPNISELCEEDMTTSANITSQHLKCVNIVENNNTRGLSSMQNDQIPKNKKIEHSVLLPRPLRFDGNSPLGISKSVSPIKTAKYDREPSV
uniref:Uncharacterized protein n=1 Tax=Euplotes crassus TaxID=5936 RepID=A0A7S3KQ37_EUPCR|mmetsp:Transcript_38739/g.38286  ORF Transcript_38739/g.38286 Transcript_38739/m.38286 type:complete len:187 (+) Transcript_38739:249-809(+)